MIYVDLIKRDTARMAELVADAARMAERARVHRIVTQWALSDEDPPSWGAVRRLHDLVDGENQP